MASPDHLERMTTWCQHLGPTAGADMEVLIAGALLHDVGVVVDWKKHYRVGRKKANEILKEVGFPEEKFAEKVIQAFKRLKGKV